ncbi:DUF6197 family protein [Nonomuraea wenchangensis]|uniref:Uncharacterized protein n=1 Tax=Nonomuraea wenchangensis TaxID=568860 RepID=A0A1I0LV38_9ACTN|nr:hypothetical protein [Nonomuraea wenchangensis]SEU46805.1 hypothetical protein SAMN05421811_127147 [Nonomuraea wenchangensis]
MTDLLADAPELTPADLIRDAIDLMRATWRVRGDFVIGRLTTGHGFCPVGAMSAIAGDVFVRGVPQRRVQVVRDTLSWLVTFHRLPRSKPEVAAGADDSRMAYARVAEWADSFPESADDELYAALDAAAAAWRPRSTLTSTTNRRNS